MLTACSTEASLKGLRVLIVDDDVDSCELMVLTLETYTVETQVVFSVREALQAFLDFQPDVLVSDIAMPDEDGYSLIRKVRQLETHRGNKVPAIAITAVATEEACRYALSVGFNQWITKPFDPDDLVAAIANLTAQQHKNS